MMHILSNERHQALWTWASGSQSEPAPNAISLCGQWSASRSKPGERWQSVEQHLKGIPPGDTCPACQAKAIKAAQK